VYYDEDFANDDCPQCHLGRLRVTQKPFLRLYRGYLFTIPDALCYQCDVCDYYSFDYSTHEVIANMVFAASVSLSDFSAIVADDTDADNLPPISRASDEDLPTQQNSPLS